MERSDVVGVDAGDAVGGALEQARKLEPAPGAVAGTVHQDKVLLRGFGNIAARVISSAWCVVCLHPAKFCKIVTIVNCGIFYLFVVNIILS